MQRNSSWRVVEQALYIHLSRCLGGSKVGYVLDPTFMHKGIALWNAIGTEITPRTEGTQIAKRIVVDRLKQETNGFYSAYVFRVEQQIADHNASGDAKYPPSSKGLLLTHATKLSARYENHLQGMVRKIAIGEEDRHWRETHARADHFATDYTRSH